MGADEERDPARRAPDGLSLTVAVRRRRADAAFYRRLHAAIQQNRKALERLSK
jgi:hypothetical protein